MENRNPGQLKFLKERLEGLKRSKKVYWGDEDVKLPKTFAVIEAEKVIARETKIIERFKKKEQKATARKKDRKRAAFAACERAVFFEDGKTALAMLDKLERTTF